MAKLTTEEFIEAIKELTVLELNDLVKACEEEFGVSAAAGVVVAAAGGDAGAAEEEKTDFDVELTEIGPNKVKVIKVVREVTGLGLKEAKELVDNAPKIVKEGAEKEPHAWDAQHFRTACSFQNPNCCGLSQTWGCSCYHNTQKCFSKKPRKLFQGYLSAFAFQLSLDIFSLSLLCALFYLQQQALLLRQQAEMQGQLRKRRQTLM